MAGGALATCQKLLKPKLSYILGLYRDNGKENGNYNNGLYRDYRTYIGVIQALVMEGFRGCRLSIAAN